MNMEEENKKSAWKIWLYLTPVYILIAIPLVKWTMKINSGDVTLSKEDYNAFNSEEGEVKNPATGYYNPDLNDNGYTLHYRKAGEPAGAGEEPAPQRAQQQVRREAQTQAPANAARQQGQAAQQRSAAQNPAQGTLAGSKQQENFGKEKGYLSAAIGKVVGSPKAVGAILNNQYIINGFMSRGTVKSATGSAQGLADYLKGGGPANFLNNSVVQAALNNPAVVSAVASSGLIDAMLKTPAAQALMNDPQALGDLINSNPQLVAMAMQNPQTFNALMSNPDVSGLVGKFDTSGLKK